MLHHAAASDANSVIKALQPKLSLRDVQLVDNNVSLRRVTSRRFTSRCVASRHVTSRHVAFRCIALRRVASREREALQRFQGATHVATFLCVALPWFK